MAIDQNGEGVTPDDTVQATVAIVTAHLRMTTTSAEQVPGLIKQVHKTICELADQGSREHCSTDQELRKTMATEPPRSERHTRDAERRLIAEQDAVFPWSGWPSLRGPKEQPVVYKGRARRHFV